jgi:DNA (cytosine-5)-methyltransferase 1
MICKWQVEIDPFCQRVLAKHWPHVRRHDDVKTWPTEDAERVDVICGGFPCQDVSRAGMRKGIRGERSGLWSEFARIIATMRPRFVIVENVLGLCDDGIGVVISDLSTIGYDAEWDVVSACSFGAPHTRKRLFIVAYPNSHRLEGVQSKLQKEQARGDSDSFVFTRCVPPRRSRWQHLPASRFCRSADGISNRVDRTKSLGNAVVPQVAEWIARRIIEATGETADTESPV